MPTEDPAVTTPDAVNIVQLSYELGGVPLKVVGPDDDGVNRVVLLDDPDFEGPVPSFAELAKAVDRHQASDKWEHPDPPALDPEIAARIDSAARLEALRQRVLDGEALTPADGLEVVEHALRTGRI